MDWMPANAAGVNNTHPNHARSEGRRTTSCTAGSYAEIDVVVSQAKRNATPVCCAARLRRREKCDARSGQWFTYCPAANPFESGLQWIVRDVPFCPVAGSRLLRSLDVLHSLAWHQVSSGEAVSIALGTAQRAHVHMHGFSRRFPRTSMLSAGAASVFPLKREPNM